MIWENPANLRLIENLSWTLLHSVWQIAGVALWLFLALRVFSKTSANKRYAIALLTMVLGVLLPLSTFVRLSQQNPTAQISVSVSENNLPISEERFEARQDFPVDKNTKTSDYSGENFLTTVGGLQENLTRKISDFSPALVFLWLLGIMFFALRLSGGVWQLHIYKTRGNESLNSDWQEKFAALREKLKIKQSVFLRQSTIVETPMVIGWLKPVILVPTSVFLQITPGELETIIAHELIHIRRYDYLTNFAQCLVEILFFYHPAMWWISAQIRRERECACDDAVVQTLENSQFVYAGALANLEEFRLAAKTNQPSILVAANGGKLMKRIERIINKKTETSAAGNSLWSASFAAALILAVLTTLFSATESSSVNAESGLNAKKERKIAVGFVSIPPLDRMENPPKDADATARLLIAKLAQYKIPAIGFVQGGMISDGEKLYPVRANIVRLWRDAGLEVGIGGYKHIWFYHTPYDDFVANTEKNERIVRQILAEKNLPLRYFSYPFLNTGKSAEEKNRFESWLGERGLKSVKYTIDNQEWMYSFAYDAARKDNDVNTMKEIQAEFLDYMSKMFDHYEAYSAEMFGRDINQTMVLTPSRLIADSAAELFGMIEKRGYRFVSMEEALSDEAYEREENFVGKAGISWFERWQTAQGKKLRAEPEVSKSVEETWNKEKVKNIPPPPPEPPAPPMPPAAAPRPPKKSS